MMLACYGDNSNTQVGILVQYSKHEVINSLMGKNEELNEQTIFVRTKRTYPRSSTYFRLTVTDSNHIKENKIIASEIELHSLHL